MRGNSRASATAAGSISRQSDAAGFQAPGYGDPRKLNRNQSDYPLYFAGFGPAGSLNGRYSAGDGCDGFTRGRLQLCQISNPCQEPLDHSPPSRLGQSAPARRAPWPYSIWFATSVINQIEYGHGARRAGADWPSREGVE